MFDLTIIWINVVITFGSFESMVDCRTAANRLANDQFYDEFLIVCVDHGTREIHQKHSPNSSVARHKYQ